MGLFDRFKWTSTIVLLKKRGSSYSTTITKGRFRELDNGQRYYEIKGHGHTKPVEFEYVHQKEGKGTIVFLKETHRGEYVPFNFTLEGDGVTTLNQEDAETLALWKQAVYRRADEVHNTDGFFSRHRAEFMFLATAIFMIILFWIFAQQINEQVASIVPSLDKVAGALNSNAPPG